MEQIKEFKTSKDYGDKALAKGFLEKTLFTIGAKCSNGKDL